MDGWVTIGTGLDTKQLDKDLKDAERKLKQYEKEAQKLAQQKAKVDLDLSAYEKEKKQIQEATDLTLQQAQTTEQTNAVIQQETFELEKLNQKYSETFKKNEDINKSINENINNQGLLNNKIQEMNNKLNQVKGLNNIKSSINDASNSISGIIKKVGKWALAIFSVRSAYMFVRQAISTISQYNEQVGTDIEYIRYALASTLQPVVERIVKLVYTLLQYVGYIAKAWFGIDLFKGAKSFESMNKSSKQIAKNLKQTTSFDEMNILSDSSTSGGGGGITAPSVDLSNWDNIEMPEWIKWIAENKDLILGFLKDFALLLGAIKIGEFILNLGKLGDAFTNLDLIVDGLGIGLIIAGASIAIKGIIDFLKDPTWDNFLTILEGISLVVAGIALLMGGWVVALVALGTAIVTYVIKNWDKVKEILGKVGDWIYEHIVLPVWEFIKKMFDTIVSIIKTAISVIKGIFTTIINIIANPFVVAYETIKEVFNNLKSAVEKIVSGIKKLFSGDLKGALNDFKSAFKNVFNALWTIAKAPLNLIIGGINSLIKGANKISFNIPSWVPGIGGKKFGINIPTIPKLAKGAILSQPGRGVPVGGAIAGEAGREGYLPLTDSQVMAQLGEAIGKYININLTNVTKLDNRVISREQKRINTQNDFAFNR